MTPLHSNYPTRFYPKIQKNEYIFGLVIETIKIISAVCFLNYLSYSFFKQPNRRVIESIQMNVLLIPFVEELFRNFLISCIRNIQSGLNSSFYQMQSTIFLSEKEVKTDGPIEIYPSVIEESMWRIYQFVVQSIEFFIPEKNKEIAEEKRKEAFAVHCSAFLFAATHFIQPNINKAKTIQKFGLHYFGGIVYGHLYTKYDSLAPGMIVHGVNNLIVVLNENQGNTYLLFIAFLVNKIGGYILAVYSPNP